MTLRRLVPASGATRVARWSAGLDSHAVDLLSLMREANHFVWRNLLEQAIDCDEATASLSLIRDAGRRVVKKMLLTGAMLALISTAHAQVVIQSPGHRPVYALPRGNGTYVIPGQRPTYITPRNGAYVVQSPGHRPVYALPRGNGTYVIPGQRPTYITPR
jgi:hypothetical protein